MAMEIKDLVRQISEAMEALSTVMMLPENQSFLAVHEDMEKLEEAFNLKATIDASVAFIGERDGAGQLVGANYPVEYFTERMGLSRAEAFARLQRGQALFGKTQEPKPEPNLNPEDEEKQKEEARKRAEREKKAQEKARRDAAKNKISAEKQRIIERALKDLNEHSDPGRAEIHAQAMEAAKTRSTSELKKLVEDMVRRANRKGKDYSGQKDPLAGFKRRSFHVSEPDADGVVTINGKLAGAEAAALKAALAPGLAPGSNTNRDSSDDKRTKSQRLADQFAVIVRSFNQDMVAKNKGIGSVVIAMTVDDLAGADWTTRFCTNTGVDLDCFDILRLGMTGSDFVLQLDSVTGVPLSAGRTRLSNFELRIIMLAMQAVCAWLGCTRPMTELEAHHILAYIQGGLTDIENLVLLCREHHRCNNDNRDGADNKGYIDRDLSTWETGVMPADGSPMRPNTTYQHEQAPGQKLRRRARERYPDFDAENRPTQDPLLYPPPDKTGAWSMA
ncbi:DUF222 domain-containing protein [Corynebacterium sp. S7]